MKLDYKIPLLFLLVILFLGSCAGFKAVEAEMKVEQLFSENKELYFLRSPLKGHVSGALIVLQQDETARVMHWRKYFVLNDLSVNWKIEDNIIVLFSEEFGLGDEMIVHKGKIDKNGDFKVIEGFFTGIYQFHSKIPEVLVKNLGPRFFNNGLRDETPEKL